MICALRQCILVVLLKAHIIIIIIHCSECSSCSEGSFLGLGNCVAVPTFGAARSHVDVHCKHFLVEYVASSCHWSKLCRSSWSQLYVVHETFPKVAVPRPVPRIVQRCLVVVARGILGLCSGAWVVPREGQDLLVHLREGLQQLSCIRGLACSKKIKKAPSVRLVPCRSWRD